MLLNFSLHYFDLDWKYFSSTVAEYNCMLITYAECVSVLCFPVMQKVFGPEMSTAFTGKSFVNMLLSSDSEEQGLAIALHNHSDRHHDNHHHHHHHHQLPPSRLSYVTFGAWCLFKINLVKSYLSC